MQHSAGYNYDHLHSALSNFLGSQSSHLTLEIVLPPSSSLYILMRANHKTLVSVSITLCIALPHNRVRRIWTHTGMLGNAQIIIIGQTISGLLYTSCVQESATAALCRETASFVNPRRACAEGVTYSTLFVCLCVCVCLSVCVSVSVTRSSTGSK